MAHIKLQDTVAIAAQDVPAGPFAVPGPASSSPEGDLPAFCRVALTVRPQITIEVWLPKENWNGRFRAEGGGGYTGLIIYGYIAEALRAGYATATTDTGHHGGGGAFALNLDGSLNRQLIEDFAWRSLYELTLKAKAIVKAYYGKPPRYSYWRGRSSGGWQGLTVVQRFPEEYDGVLAAWPAINWDRFIPATLWPNVVMHQELGRPIDPAKLEAVRKAAVAACDVNDGVVDQLISDPRKCRYDPAALVCNGNDDSATCLIPGEAQAIRKIWDGPRSTTGERLWFGLERGAPFTTIAGSEPNSIGLDYLRYWIKQDPTFDWQRLKEADFDQLLRESSKKFKDAIASDRADLRRFRARNGKLLILHGEHDEIIFPRGTVHYFNRVLAANGGKEQVDLFARLFMLPGIQHGGIGDGPFSLSARSSSDLMVFDALVNWVEKGVAPDRVLASQRLPDGVVRTRPLCAYPRTAKWTGLGSSDDASNFTCVDGSHDPGDFRVNEVLGAGE